MYCKNRIRYCTALHETGRYGDFLSVDYLPIGKEVGPTKVWIINQSSNGDGNVESSIICSLTGRYLRFWVTVKEYRHRVVPIKWSDKLLEVKFAELSPIEQSITCPQPLPVPTSY